MYAEGGVYLDTDIVMLEPIHKAVNLCGGATLGYDIPGLGGHVSGKQMKILASVPRPPGAAWRARSPRTCATGAAAAAAAHGHRADAAARCYENNSAPHLNVSLTYRDSIRAQYPPGLVGADGLGAFEQPNAMDYPSTDVAHMGTAERAVDGEGHAPERAGAGRGDAVR